MGTATTLRYIRITGSLPSRATDERPPLSTPRPSGDWTQSYDA